MTSRLLILWGVVSIGFSQLAFEMIVQNPEWFPSNPVFIAWVILWCQVAPFLALFILDILLFRISSEHGPAGFWRSLLYALTFLSLLRQAEVVDQQFFDRIFGSAPGILIYLLLSIVIIVVSIRFRRITNLFYSFLGIGGFALTILFLARIQTRPLFVRDFPREVASSNTSSARPDIFVIIFDELSFEVLLQNDALDAKSFPNFADLAARSLWFTNATANHMLSQESVPSLLTGKIAPEATSPTFFQLVASDYRVNFFETVIPVEDWFFDGGDNKGIDVFKGTSYLLTHYPHYTAKYLFQALWDLLFLSDEPFHNTSAFHLTFEKEMEEFLRTMDTGKTRGELWFWHTSIPHAPFIYGADGRRHPASFFRKSANMSEFRSILADYREQVRFADRLLGRVVAHMKRRNLYDDSIIVVTGDHGLRVWGHLQDHINMMAHVPLLIRAPNLPPGIMDVEFQHTDLVPTLLDLLAHAYNPAQFDGVSAFLPNRPARQKIFHFQSGTYYVFDATSDTWKAGKMPALHSARN